MLTQTSLLDSMSSFVKIRLKEVKLRRLFTATASSWLTQSNAALLLLHQTGTG